MNFVLQFLTSTLPQLTNSKKATAAVGGSASSAALVPTLMAMGVSEGSSVTVSILVGISAMIYVIVQGVLDHKQSDSKLALAKMLVEKGLTPEMYNAVKDILGVSGPSAEPTIK